MLVLLDPFSVSIHAFLKQHQHPVRYSSGKCSDSSQIVQRCGGRVDILPLGFTAKLELDQGIHFTEKFHKFLFNSKQTKSHIFHMPSHPQSSGQVDRSDRTIKLLMEFVQINGKK